MAKSQDSRVRWGAITIVTAAGLLVTGSPFLLSWAWGSEFGSLESLASSTLINVGTALLLAALVFFIERNLIKRVGGVAEQRAEAVVQTRTKELQDANAELVVRIDALQDQLDQQVNAADSRRFAQASRVGSEVSFDSVADALEEANGLGALFGGDAVVPASDRVDGPRVSLSWAAQQQDDRERDLRAGQPRLTLRYVVEKRLPNGGVPVVEVDWEPTAPATEVIRSLRDEMRLQGFGAEAKQVSAPLFQHLQSAVDAAMAARVARQDAWFEGELAEWVWDGWAITDRGLVSREHGVWASAEFPQDDFLHAFGQSRVGPEKFEGTKPEGVDDILWETAVRRAHAHHPDRSFAHGIGIATYFTPSNSPRKS